MIFERLRALRACFPSIFSGGRLSNCDITYLKDLFYRGVPPFQFPLPQVTTWKLLDGRNHCSENIHKIFQEFYNTLVGVYFAFSPMHSDFNAKYSNTSRKYFLGKSFGQTESSLMVVIVRLGGFPGFTPSNLQSCQNQNIVIL